MNAERKKTNFFSTWQKPMTSILSHQAPLCCFNTYTHSHIVSPRATFSLFSIEIFILHDATQHFTIFQTLHTAERREREYNGTQKRVSFIVSVHYVCVEDDATIRNLFVYPCIWGGCNCQTL